MIVCECGNQAWFINNSHLKCTSCNNLRGLPIENIQSSLIQEMGIPPTLTNAIELAHAHLDRLKKKEQILNKIQNIIDEE